VVDYNRERERRGVAGEGESRVAEALTRVPRGVRKGRGETGSAKGAHRREQRVDNDQERKNEDEGDDEGDEDQKS
jgi:hypothetical protein